MTDQRRSPYHNGIGFLALGSGQTCDELLPAYYWSSPCWRRSSAPPGLPGRVAARPAVPGVAAHSNREAREFRRQSRVVRSTRRRVAARSPELAGRQLVVVDPAAYSRLGRPRWQRLALV